MASNFKKSLEVKRQKCDVKKRRIFTDICLIQYTLFYIIIVFFWVSLSMLMIYLFPALYMMFCAIWYYLCNLKTWTLLKTTLLHGCFSHFLTCTNGTKSCKASHMMLTICWNNSIHGYDLIITQGQLAFTGVKIQKQSFSGVP